ncbi:Alkaline phosphatase synthesis transcriptional regulatory protein PhoP [Planktothrix tepida]|uniref:Alkaline phosphatase synthesis transcriptional regulatory protein PhoP n=2 Tax=Planktothrix TaxID=54304 RepID=A0A1J1LK64_9CYAN|nr:MULTISPECIES: response regulator transcription factor [Planktothrix]CAD5943243.1 Alkaline phosphatase synthesis transcriptional regulatory protein PhoP [Planktothrix tepida]CAD5968153.1 Alkaline phosphatase synthesis transcriptional regulatory protein PhoP [Planktothrix pseudagardhii]CUR32973.1 Alkaline phosphatase synthesis transcriptional regulatory protein PhoP [Planktothrix tepida PCC 9214]
MASAKILVVDDDPAIRNLISRYLSQQDYQVDTAGDGHSALERFEQFNPDLVVLDLNLPDTTGLALCREMQSRTSVFILMLTSEKDPKLGLKEGADDFVTKPFDLEELNLRIKAILKRQRTPVQTQPKSLVYGDLTIDPNRREVYIRGEIIPLSALEFDLLYCLARKPGRAWRRAELLQEVWDYEYEGEQRVVDVHIGQIRKKIEPDADKPSFIKTIRGVGYMFDRRTTERQ